MSVKTTKEKEADEARDIAHLRWNVLIGVVLLIGGATYAGHEFLIDTEPDFGNALLSLGALSIGFGFLSWSVIQARGSERYQAYLHSKMN